MRKFDLVVIGAGAGGLNSALSAANLGKRVLLIERHKPGGECTWAGCIPSKALIQIAKDVRVAEKFGFVSVDTTKVMRDIRSLIEKAHQAEAVPSLERAGIEYINGTAILIDRDTLEVNEEKIQAESIVIATGSSPVVPDIAGLSEVPYLTNENIFNLPDLPKSLIVLGAGAIGVELSQALQRLGVRVKLIDRSATVLAREEPEFAFAVQELLSCEGVEVFTGYSADHVRLDGKEVVLRVSDSSCEREIRGESILLALGRMPNVHTINLDDVGIDYDSTGIHVNDFLQTSVNGIYAVGDVVGPYLFSHTGGYQARKVIRNLYEHEELQSITLNGVAWCTFTEPELARCGLTEREAKRLYGDAIDIFTESYTNLDRAVVDQKTLGMAKIICDQKGVILGASILGERACELLCEIQVLKQQGIPLQELQESIHPYPGYSELLLSLSLTAYSYYWKSVNE